MSTALRPIDPFAPAPHGEYRDQLVVVTRTRDAPRPRVRTAHFEVWHDAGRVHLHHRLPPERIDNDIAVLLADELFAPGWVSGTETFERLLTGVVLTSATGPLDAWTQFYRNTLLGLAPGATRLRGSHNSFAPLYWHCLELVPSGSVLEIGCCFGFLSLQLAAATRRVTASDISTGTLELLGRVAPRLGVGLDTLVCDAARVPAPDGSFDTVAAVHLLEHLEPDHGAQVIAEALRLARRRVVVAVPYEDEPTAAYGHVRSVTADDLTEMGRRSGWRWDVHERHGGWLVLDRREKDA